MHTGLARTGGTLYPRAAAVCDNDVLIFSVNSDGDRFAQPGQDDAGHLGPVLPHHSDKLAAIRSAFPALRLGRYENVVIKNQQLVFRRSTDSQRVYVVLNLEPQEVHVEFPHNEPVLQDVLNDNAIFNNDGGRTWLPVSPCSARILVGTPDRFSW